MIDWVTGFVEQGGYLSIVLLMLLENVFPPIPSELIMPLAGYAAARGQLDVVLVTLAGTAGSVAGATVWYVAGRRLGCERIRTLAARRGRWLTVTPAEVDEARDWFRRHCGKAVLIGRLVPAVRTLISVPAGVAEMALPRFLAFTTVGTLLWTGLLTGAGYLLGDRYDRVSGWLDPVSNVVVGLLALWYVYRVVTFAPGGTR